MALALGIDTGGTYTDGAVIDLATGAILAVAKALTTRHDLSEGIAECLLRLNAPNLGDVQLVSLSTTLATNGIVEGQGGEVALILIGGRPEGRLPTPNTIVIRGGHDIRGREIQPLDRDRARRAIIEFREQVDAFAVAGYLSVRNPEHEVEVKRLIGELSGKPTVCGHELTTALGYYERAVTAALNARLIPIITGLMDSVKAALAGMGIPAPLMVVKGDGTLMSEAVARSRPIETILSGPAASVVGGTFLSGERDAIIVDIGGTTTDIAVVHQGNPRINAEGASVGGWLTRVKAANISTVGAGGDSYIQVTWDKQITIGPRRVIPLSLIGRQHDSVIRELQSIWDDGFSPVLHQPTDFAISLRDPGGANGLSPMDREIMGLVRERPRSLYSLARALGTDANLISLERLERAGAVMRSSLTPSDILHADGTYLAWSREAAILGTRIMARRQGVPEDEFCAAAVDAFQRKVALAVLEKIVSDDGGLPTSERSPLCRYLVAKAFDQAGGNGSRDFSLDFISHKPIVGIGAPVQAYLPKVAAALHTRLCIPPHAEVANAVGAVTGEVVETVELLIKPGEDAGYVLHAPWGRIGFRELDEAVAQAREAGERYILDKALLAGAADPRVMANVREVRGKVGGEQGDSIFLETRIQVTAVGRPRWEAEG